MIASQEQEKKFFDKSTREVIKGTSLFYGVACAFIYTTFSSLVVSQGVVDLLCGDSLKDVLSSTRWVHRDVMRMLNKKLPVFGAVTVGSAVAYDKYHKPREKRSFTY